MTLRSYSEMIQVSDFESRFDYLRLRGEVGASTFGYDRFLNQNFYKSTQWRHIRNHVIARDEGMDLGCAGYEIYDRPIIHHMNPMTPDDLEHGREEILDPEFLITTTLRTHNAIHFGNEKLLSAAPVERRPGDTVPWRR